MALNGRAAVVTGAASGIGRAIGLRLARDGAAVAVWDLNGDGAEETVSMVAAAGGRAIACQADSASADGIAAALERTHGELGPVTILVNNAAITGIVPFLDLKVEDWDRMMAVNLRGPFLCSQAIIPDMLAAGWGRIVNISSSSAQFGAPCMAHYVTSKGGIIGFTKTLAMEFAEQGITVNAIPPGFVDTPMLRANVRDFDANVAASPMKRAGKPDDIAAACAYLVSEEAEYITGQTISVNGGRYLL